MRDIILPIKCSTLGRIFAYVFAVVVALVIAKLFLFGIIDDPFWIQKIGTIGDRPDYHGRTAFMFANVMSVAYLACVAMIREWRFPIRCKEHDGNGS